MNLGCFYKETDESKELLHAFVFTRNGNILDGIGERNFDVIYKKIQSENKEKVYSAEVDENDLAEMTMGINEKVLLDAIRIVKNKYKLQK